MEYALPFQQLFDSLMRWEQPNLYEGLLQTWLRENSGILQPFEQFRHFNGPNNPYSVADEDLWSLYALSRVVDVLLETFQPATDSETFTLSLPQFTEFFRGLGLTIQSPTDFHPFWCEVVEVVQDENPQQFPIVEAVYWPALTFGDLLISRAGVKVRAGKAFIDASIASSSTLYFAYTRRYRRVEDLSHGWGHNSQWRTDFRRDYLYQDFYLFNVDGRRGYDEPPLIQSLNFETVSASQMLLSTIGDNEDLGEEERRELLSHRCFVRCPKESNDRWPYDDCLILKQSLRFC